MRLETSNVKWSPLVEYQWTLSKAGNLCLTVIDRVSPSHSKIKLYRQVNGMSVHCYGWCWHRLQRSDADPGTTVSEEIRRSFEQLLPPSRDLVAVHLELACQLGGRLIRTAPRRPSP